VHRGPCGQSKLPELQGLSPASCSVSLSAHDISPWLVADRYTAHLSLALKVGTGTEKRYALIHDRLADPEVALKPLLGAGVFGKSIWLYTGSGFSFSSDLVVLYGSKTERWIGRAGVVVALRKNGWTYVRPVERRTPARKADTMVVVSDGLGRGKSGLAYLKPHRRRNVRLCRAVTCVSFEHATRWSHKRRSRVVGYIRP
jgi:hypothetical protein